MKHHTIIYPCTKKAPGSKPGSPCFALQFYLQGTAYNGSPEHTYNILYIPSGKNISSEKCRRPDFDIRFLPDYLLQLADDFPVLAGFRSKADHRVTCRLCERPIAAGPQLLSIIHDMLHCRFSGLTKDMYIEAKISELLILSLEQVCKQLRETTFRLSGWEAESIREAKRLLLQRMDKPYSLKELSRKVAVNVTKLKKGFKQLYGTTVFGYFRNEQMKQAQQLLRSTGMQVREVALATGYKNVSNFSIAFKKYFGYAPSYLRKNSHRDRLY